MLANLNILEKAMNAIYNLANNQRMPTYLLKGLPEADGKKPNANSLRNDEKYNGIPIKEFPSIHRSAKKRPRRINQQKQKPTINPTEGTGQNKQKNNPEKANKLTFNNGTASNTATQGIDRKLASKQGHALKKKKETQKEICPTYQG